MTLVPDWYDWRAPDISRVFAQRIERLNRIKADPSCLPALKLFYRDNPAQFICDWGCVDDPRNVKSGTPSILPMILFPRQVELVEWIMERWRRRERGIMAKSRDIGATSVTTALACTLCLFYDGMSIGFGSRRQDYVDSRGEPKSIFEKIRQFMRLLPAEFRGGWNEDCAPKERCFFPESKSKIGGDIGDDIGRGDRRALYFVDEAAHLEHPLMAEHSLSATSDVRIDLSSVNGMANAFAELFHSGKVSTFIYHYTDDPRKDADWAVKKRASVPLVTWKQEYELDFLASVENQVIPPELAMACVDAHIKLGIRATGARSAALDLADGGADKNALAIKHGIVVEHIESWSGEHGKMFETAWRVFNVCAKFEALECSYDADGLGGPFESIAAVCNDKLRDSGGKRVKVHAYRGSAAVQDPERKALGTDRKNEDYYANAKAQSWLNLRRLLQNTFDAINGLAYNPDDLISISSTCADKRELLIELSQATFSINNAGKMVIDKMPDGQKSPNCADALVMLFAPKRKPMQIRPDVLQQPPYAVRA